MSSIYEIVEASPRHTTLLALIRKAHLVRALSCTTGKGLVLLAPTDAAFARLKEVPKSPAVLKKILLKHVRSVSSAARHTQKIKATNGYVVSVTKVFLK